MAEYETKLKLGRKLKNVDTAKASDNQVSVLFRYDENGQDRHVSVSIESDDMRPDDVAALLELLDSRGILTRGNSKTWVSQPQSSEAKFGPSMTWQSVDIEAMSKRPASM
ncbi:MAG TPA: hypothetical protein VM370_10690 [Candidatus Thermoplasmatota archaeon]|nr:hypothetical protein [Candidatus Thermoplasmatota archaeon]